MPFSSFLRALLVAALVGALPFIAACGGGSSPEADPFVAPPPSNNGGQGGQTPPPPPPQSTVWNAAAFDYGRVATFGSFPSSIVRRGDTIFATDADQIEAAGANVLAIDVSGPAPTASTLFPTTNIKIGQLVDSGGFPANANVQIGFGYFVNDLLVVSDTLAFLLVNAGGSDSTPSLSNVVVFDPSTGNVRQTVNLANPYVSVQPLLDSSGTPVVGNTFIQSGAEGIAYVKTSATTGRLFVAMSNLIFGAPSFGATKLPGTVQVFDVFPSATAPVANILGSVLATLTFRTQAYNPVAIESIQASPSSPGDTPTERVLVTAAGTTGFDANFNLVAQTNATVEAYDAVTIQFEGSFTLGLAGLSGIRPAIGSDGAGHQVGFFASAVNGEVYLVRLDGLYTGQIDPSKLAVLRGPANGIPITAAQSGGPGGNITGIALAPDGRTLVVSGFGDLFAFPSALPGKLFLLNLPIDVVTGSGFGVNFVPGSSEFASVSGRTLGEIVLVPNPGNRPDVYVNVGGTLDASFFGNGTANLGTLQTFGLIK